MDKEKLRRYLNGLSPKKEEIEVGKWLENNNSEKEINKIFEASWEESAHTIYSDNKKNNLWSKIEQKTGNKSEITIDRNRYSLLKSAAVWLILAGFLFLSAKVVLENSSKTQEEVVLTEWIEKSVPSGEKLYLILPDESKVLVNSNSNIKFPSTFNKQFREVYLEGEAFFEVHQDLERPFIVFAGELTTEVLGTSFNVSNRPTGTKSEKLTVKPFKYANEIAWKDGQIKFQKKKLKAVLQQLEDWYGVKFDTDKNINIDRTVSGTFQNDNLDNLLSGLGFTLNFNHKIENKNVKLNSN